MAYFSDVKYRFPLFSELVWKNDVQIINGVFAVVSGHRGLASVADDKIKVRLKDKEVTLCGNNIKLIAVTEWEVYVSGDITSVCYED